MKFRPINGKGIARKTVHDCIACFRQKPTGVDQLMGNLPSERVTPKAVTDLTTEAFIAALKRLCARRGRISTLMSDNATNFKGAAAELNRFIKLICNKNETLANYFASEAIQWKFIRRRSPNFLGLWEAGVKSFKHHLYRTLVNSKITFEEFETIIIQIEGILNSRPLVPLSDNINEYEVLTPEHFIIGRPISAIPEPAILDISDNRLSRWQYTTKCVQTIWKRWKNDYLNHLQQRNKWQFEKNNVAVGCLVLLKENDLPPCKWTMARILEVIYGTDGKDLEPFLETGSAGRRPGQGCRWATTPNEDRYLVLTARRHRNMNAILLQQHLRSATGTTVSTQSVRNRFHGVEHVNWRRNKWSNVLFSDESRFSVHPDNRRIFIWRDRGSRNNLAFVPESVRFGGGGVLVYGGISIDGRTDLYIIRDGPLTARRYRDEILRPIVVPYAVAIGDDLILMDDNCRPPHANLVEDFLFEEGIVRMEWPACFPDMNPIEHV
ncbi:integrase catalytic domain-containing protein [Trichonephila clavipes]|nr:integrase catalytic domain-containing protein [Trichonephila clavipes]